MANSWQNPRLVSPIRTDVPELQEKLIALLKQDPTPISDIPVGAKRFYEVSSGKWQWQEYNGSSWATVPLLQHNVDQLDGYHAAITPAANIIAVRNADKKLEGDITGNAATSTSATTLSQTLPVNKGGTGATTAAAARTNLGVPPTSHASSSTTYGLATDTNYGHVRSDGTTTNIVAGEVVVKDVLFNNSISLTASGLLGKALYIIGSMTFDIDTADFDLILISPGSENHSGTYPSNNAVYVRQYYYSRTSSTTIGNRMQVAYGYGTNGMWRRYCTSGSWSAWVKVIDETDLATTSTPGIVKPGAGMIVDAEGALNVNLSDVSTPGIVKPGTGMTVDAEGALNVNLSDVSTPGIVKSSVTALAGAVPLGGVDGGLDFSWTLGKIWIGVPRFWRSTTLPANHCWANGDFISFADWPELKEVYDAGGFAGMLLAYNASSTTKAANLGKWRPDAANPTGLYTPNLSGQFFRNWAQGAGKDAGAWGRDEIRNMTGKLGDGSGSQAATDAGGLINTGTGVFSKNIKGLSRATGERAFNCYVKNFDASNVVPTGPENVPPHVWQPVVLYLGRPA